MGVPLSLSIYQSPEGRNEDFPIFVTHVVLSIQGMFGKYAWV